MSAEISTISAQAINYIENNKFNLAEEVINNALAKYPQEKNLLLILSGIYAQTERHSIAAEILEKLIADNFHHPAIFDNLYIIYLRLEDYSRTLTTLLKKLEICGESQELLINILKLAKHCGKNEIALRICRRLLALFPEDAELYTTLGILYNALNRHEVSAQAMYQAFILQPDLVNSYNNLAIAYYEARCHNFAVEYLREGIKKFPADIRLRTTELLFSLTACYWEGTAEYFAALTAQIYLLEQLIKADDFKLNSLQRANLNIGKAGLFDAFCFLFSEHTTPQLQKTVGRVLACEWEEYFAQPVGYLKYHQESHQHDQRKLRIGYVSADFRRHATMFLLTEIFEKHNKDNFEIFAYSIATDDFSSYSQRLKSAVDCFRQVDQASDRQIAELIKQDRIDILVDLKGYTRFSRGGIFALRPAPIIVNWLGYPATMGEPRIADYIIGDPVVTPIAHEIYFSEKIAQMPVCYQANDRQRPLPAAKSRDYYPSLPGKDAFILCSFNNSTKFSESWMRVWLQILQRIPHAYLWLLRTSFNVEGRLANFFIMNGIESYRLIFSETVDLPEHLTRLQCADLALDTFPCNSHTTASDALWAGVPLVTCIGSTFASRVAASTLNAVGLNDLVVNNSSDYVNKVVELANDRTKLQAYRQHLQDNRYNCALFDSERFSSDLESLYQKMWLNHLDGQHQHIIAK